jgi:TPR repeat protein
VSSPQTRSPAPAADVMPLLSRGNAMLALGDIAAARLFYERAASLGSAQGAVSLGKTYDPGFLAAIRAAGVTPDRDAAATWYRKGVALGDTEGSHLLVTLTAGR